MIVELYVFEFTCTSTHIHASYTHQTLLNGKMTHTHTHLTTQPSAGHPQRNDPEQISLGPVIPGFLCVAFRLACTRVCLYAVCVCCADVRSKLNAYVCAYI